MIIPTRILKQGIPAEPAAGGSGERALLASAKRLTIAMLAGVSEAYGERVRDEQQILAHIADPIIDGYAIESVLARTEKLAARDPEAGKLAADMTSVFVADAIDRIVHSAKQVANALGDRAAAIRDRIAPLAGYAGVDSVAARRRIADAVLKVGGHPY